MPYLSHPLPDPDKATDQNKKTYRVVLSYHSPDLIEQYRPKYWKDRCLTFVHISENKTNTEEAVKEAKMLFEKKIRTKNKIFPPHLSGEDVYSGLTPVDGSPFIEELKEKSSKLYRVVIPFTDPNMSTFPFMQSVVKSNIYATDPGDAKKTAVEQFTKSFTFISYRNPKESVSFEDANMIAESFHTGANRNYQSSSTTKFSP